MIYAKMNTLEHFLQKISIINPYTHIPLKRLQYFIGKFNFDINTY